MTSITNTRNPLISLANVHLVKVGYFVMSIISHQNVSLVEIHEDVVYIDSRVYCKDVIQVTHRDWMQDTALKYQNVIEARFGQYRIETDYVNIPNGGRKGSKYILLTEAQCNALLVFSRNIGNVAEKKLDLVADFEEAKQLLRNQFERQYKQAHLNHIEFNYSLNQLHEVSGIVNKSQVKNSVVEYFKLDKDYIIIEKQIMMNQDTYEILVTSFCSARGTDISKLPEYIRLHTESFFKFTEDKRRNRVVAKRQRVPEGQLNLFDS